ncbi:MAG: PEP-CTERM sorting domain-containing protein [Pirellulaceae bacterium]|nr:PEP-CTERM sorting domain-containing protein [Pirellulaceae bacterium]
MSLKFHRILIAAATLLLSLGGSTSHAALVFTSGVQANFTFTTVVNNPLGLPDNLALDFVATGLMTFSLDDSVANATNMAFTNATGSLTVNSPVGFAGATMGPHEFVSGQFQNITRDGLGNITGGNVVDLRMRWQMFAGVRLYTADSLPFNGAMTGAPFQVGDVMAGPAPFNVYLDEGLGNPGQPGGDRLAVIGSNRLLTITAVPEPSSLALLALSGAVCVVFKRRIAKSAQA